MPRRCPRRSSNGRRPRDRRRSTRRQSSQGHPRLSRERQHRPTRSSWFTGSPKSFFHVGAVARVCESSRASGGLSESSGVPASIGSQAAFLHDIDHICAVSTMRRVGLLESRLVRARTGTPFRPDNRTERVADQRQNTCGPNLQNRSSRPLSAPNPPMGQHGRLLKVTLDGDRQTAGTGCSFATKDCIREFIAAIPPSANNSAMTASASDHLSSQG